MHYSDCMALAGRRGRILGLIISLALLHNHFQIPLNGMVDHYCIHRKSAFQFTGITLVPLLPYQYPHPVTVATCITQWSLSLIIVP